MIKKKMNKKTKQVIYNFKLLQRWENKYLWIIQFGEKLKKLQINEKINSNKILGCASQTWLIHKKINNLFFFYGDSNALIIKGFIAIIIIICSGKTKESINQIDFKDLFNKLNLKNNLTPNRTNGLFFIAKKIKSLASLIN